MSASSADPQDPSNFIMSDDKTTKQAGAGDAADISHRYRLADLARARIFARRLYMNSLARRASIAHHETTLDYDYIPEVDEAPLPYTRYLCDLDADQELVTSRPDVPTLTTRLMYNRRLAELEADRIDAAERADRLIARYVTRAKTRAAIEGRSRDQDKRTSADAGDKSKEDNTPADVDDEIMDAYRDDLDLGYIDVHNPYDLAYPDALPRMRALRRRYPFYRRHFRPLGVTTRLMERRSNNV